ncbi:MAG TPA: isocitrate lyase/phosphoenolpyruvate mutase family protein [Telluria sp.]|nr:isocitrate lyase/phosphoenolpyruvate mutase family protein [Telluria sp.]
MDTAELFHHLHRQPQPLVLPNAWDAGSALLIERQGAAAVATTSAGVAWSLGYPDGDALPLDEHLACVRRLARVLRVPLSVDIESGYSDDPAQVGAHVARFLDAGAVGINIQDGSGTPVLLARKIERARAAAESAGVKLYINVRTDVFARKLVEPERMVEEVLARCAAYAQAGADGIFPLAVTDPQSIRAIAAGTALLLNVIAWPGQAAAADLAALGVRRISAGSWLPQTLWRRTAELASDFLAGGASGPVTAEAAPYAAINRMFTEIPADAI